MVLVLPIGTEFAGLHEIVWCVQGTDVEKSMIFARKGLHKRLLGSGAVRPEFQAVALRRPPCWPSRYWSKLAPRCLVVCSLLGRGQHIVYRDRTSILWSGRCRQLVARGRFCDLTAGKAGGVSVVRDWFWSGGRNGSHSEHALERRHRTLHLGLLGSRSR